MSRPLRFLALCAVLSSACVDALDVQDRACPCATGWTCCPGANTCVADGAMCPAPDAGTPGLSLLAGAIGGRGSADGIGAAARIDDPVAGVVVGGQLYFIDGEALRKLDIGSGSVTTIAGSNLTSDIGLVRDGVGVAARFDRPRGIDSDGAGALLITDGAAIRRVDLATATVTTPVTLMPPDVDAENAAILSSIASDAKGGAYVTVALRNSILHVALATGVVTTVAGDRAASGSADGLGAAASFSAPGALVLSAATHQLIVADVGNATVRALDTQTMQVTTLAGSAGTGGPSVDGTGAAARFGSIDGMALAMGGAAVDVLDVDGTDAIRTVTLATGAVVSDLTIGGSIGGLFVADSAGQEWLLGLDASIGAQSMSDAPLATIAGLEPSPGTQNGTGAEARFSNPIAVASDQHGNVYVQDRATIREIDATGNVTTLVGTAGASGYVDAAGTSARLDDQMSAGLAYDGNGHLYLADSIAHTIRAIDLSTRAVTTYAGVADEAGLTDGSISAARFTQPQGIVHDGHGALFVGGGQPLRRIDLASGQVTSVAGTSMGTTPLDSDGSVLYATTPDGTLSTIDPTSGATTSLVPTGCGGTPVDGPAASACVYQVVSARLDGKGTLYFTDRDLVRALDLATKTVTTVLGDASHAAGVRLGALPGGLNAPASLAFIGARLVVADPAEYSILVATVPSSVGP